MCRTRLPASNLNRQANSIPVKENLFEPIVQSYARLFKLNDPHPG
jgi:hypothetical protein